MPFPSDLSEISHQLLDTVRRNDVLHAEEKLKKVEKACDKTPEPPRETVSGWNIDDPYGQQYIEPTKPTVGAPPKQAPLDDEKERQKFIKDNKLDE